MLPFSINPPICAGSLIRPIDYTLIIAHNVCRLLATRINVIRRPAEREDAEMYFIDSLLTAVSLALDAFAMSVCIGAGSNSSGNQSAIRMGGACGFFQFVMPIIGGLVGGYAVNFISSIDHWVAFGLLAFVGIEMIRGALSPEGKCFIKDPTLSPALLYIAFVTSIDALAVGASFVLADRPVIPMAISAGTITLALCFIGVRFGGGIGERFGRRAGLAGGAVLILIGLNILREHLM
jgi:putative Mn2+ efflux pump MntP